MPNIYEPSPEDITRYGGTGQHRQLEIIMDLLSRHSRFRDPRYLMDDPNISDLVRIAIFFGEDETVISLLQEELSGDALDALLVERPFRRPDPELIRGEYLLGYDQATGAPAGIDPNEVHFLACAATGKGKSSLFRNLIIQHIDAGERVLVFDFENEYRHLLNDDRINYLGLDDGGLKWNPLEPPPGMKPSLYRQMFCAPFSDALGVLVASKGSLNHVIKDLYTLYGVDDGSGVYPSMLDLEQELARRMASVRPNSRQYNYYEVDHNRVQGFNDVFGDMVDCSSGMPLHILTQGNLVIEMHGYDFEFQSLLVNLMVIWICCYRIANGLRNRPEHNLALFVDEAQRIFDVSLERRPYQSSTATISHLVATVRKYNLKFFVAAQIPSLLSRSISANAFTKLQMPLGHGEDIMSMSASQFLDEDQTRYARLLGTGEAIVKFSDRWLEPFVISIPYEL